MIETIKENNDGIKIIVTDKLVRCTLQETRILWSYEVSGQGMSEDDAVENFLNNLDKLRDELEHLHLKK